MAATARPDGAASVEAAVAAALRESAAAVWRDRAVYLVDSTWWFRWRAHAGWSDLEGLPAGGTGPGPISNAVMCKSAESLATGLVWKVHYDVLPGEAWAVLAAAYGGGPAIRCGVGDDGRAMLETAFVVVDRDGAAVDVAVDAAVDAAVGEAAAGPRPRAVGEAAAAALPGSEAAPLACVCSACGLFLDLARGAKGCGRCRSVAYCGRRCQQSHWAYHRRDCAAAAASDVAGVKRSLSSASRLSCESLDGVDAAALEATVERLARSREARELRRGCAGLANIGNTCYFNATLQCLNRVGPLSRYFASDAFCAHGVLNTGNPLGCGGRMAREYASVVKRLWLGRERVVSPSNLLRVVARKNESFCGRTQHDAHELLATLLDGLHEDLNRVRRKPYCEKPASSCSAEDARVAQESWAMHVKRDASIVVDTFSGLLRSTLECPACDGRSISFDPFSTIELELNGAPQIDDALFDAPTRHEDEDAHVQTRAGRIYLYADMLPYAAPSVPLSRETAVQTLRACCAAAMGVSPARLAIYALSAKAAPFALSDGDYLPDFAFDGSDDGGDDGTEDDLRDGVIAVCVTPREHALAFVRYDVPAFGASPSMVPPRLVAYDAKWPLSRLRTACWRATRRAVGEAALVDRGLTSIDMALKKRQTARTNGKDANVKDKGCKRQEPTYEKNNGRRPDADDADVSVRDWLGEDDDDVTILSVCWEGVDADAAPADEGSPPKGVPAVPGLSVEASCRFVDSARRAAAAFALAAAPALGLPMDFSPFAKLQSPPAALTLEACLRRFTASERLDEENPWYCDRCKGHKRAAKSIKLWRLPNVLVFALKRFELRHSGDFHLARKLEVAVDFPLEDLDMRPYLAHGGDVSDVESTVYDLFGVINHYGETGYGHYTAFARDLAAGQDEWLKFDDSKVSAASTDEVQSKSAYLLFYARRDFVESELELTRSNAPRSDSY